MNESMYEPIATGSQETNLPESLGPSVESQEFPQELLQQQKYLEGQLPLETYEEPKEEHQEQPAPTPRPKLKKDEYKNMAQLRLQLEQVQRERDEAKARLQEKNEGYLGDDDLAEGKHLNRVQRELQSLKEELVQTRLKTQYPDFDSIVTVDNLAALRNQYPELAASLQSNNDLFTQASSAYTLIKKLNISPDHEAMVNKERVNANFTKPRSAASLRPQAGDSPLTKATMFAEGLSEDLKRQLFREMNDARKGYN